MPPTLRTASPAIALSLHRFADTHRFRMIYGFEPIAGPDARALILGSVPSQRSLDERRYYAHPRNAFWPIMERLLADGASLTNAQRGQMLKRAGIALWDVLHAAERSGSLDSAIVDESAVPNDIAGLLRDNPGIGRVLFNGAKAESLFNKHIATTLPLDRRIECARLPSTSPAHAGLSFDAKLSAWATALDMAGIDCIL